MNAINVVLTNSTDATADYLCDRLASSRTPVVRLDTDRIASDSVVRFSTDSLDLEIRGEPLRCGDVANVIYRRPRPVTTEVDGDAFQVRHTANEWAEVLEGYLASIPLPRWINHPQFNIAASHKIDQLRVARRHGLTVPVWCVSNSPDAAREFIKNYRRRVIVKPLWSGYIERESEALDTIIYTNEFQVHHHRLLELLPSCPVLFQACVEKDEDVRVIYLNGKVVAASMVARDSTGAIVLDVRRDNMQAVQYRQTDVPAVVGNGISAFMKSYNLRFGAIDFVVGADGHWYFLEVNPNGQWAWLDQIGVLDVGSLFVETLAGDSRVA